MMNYLPSTDTGLFGAFLRLSEWHNAHIDIIIPDHCHQVSLRLLKEWEEVMGVAKVWPVSQWIPLSGIFWRGCISITEQKVCVVTAWSHDNHLIFFRVSGRPLSPPSHFLASFSSSHKIFPTQYSRPLSWKILVLDPVTAPPTWSCYKLWTCPPYLSSTCPHFSVNCIHAYTF